MTEGLVFHWLSCGCCYCMLLALILLATLAVGRCKGTIYTWRVISAGITYTKADASLFKTTAHRNRQATVAVNTSMTPGKSTYLNHNVVYQS